MAKSAIIFLFIFACFYTPPTLGQDKSTKVKAVVLFKLTSYINWPGQEKSNLTICTYGGDPFKGLLEKINKIQKKQLAVKHIKTGKPLDNCQLVFLKSAKNLSSISNANILTVNDEKNFAKKGGMIEISQKTKKIEFIVNLKQLNNAKLKASSRFLELAKVIR